MAMKPVVFVSHIHEDSDSAKRIKEWLEERLLGAVDVFVSSDGASIRGGDRWMETVETALRASKLVIVLCTKASIGRRWVFFEAGGAFFLGARVIPVCAGGLLRDQLETPLSFLQAFHLNEADHLRQLLAEIASHAGLRTPSADFSADAQWLATGVRFTPQTPLQSGPKAEYTFLSLKEVNERVTQVPQEQQAAAERALLMFEYTFDSSYFSEEGFHTLEEGPGWIKHFVTKLQGAGLPLPAGGGNKETRRRATVREIAAHLRALAAQEGWTKADALLDLESLLPDAIPLVVRDVLIIHDLEWQSTLGWRMQLDLIGRLAFHGDPLVVRMIGTLGRRDGFPTMNSFTSGLIQFARQILIEDEELERWFLEFGRMKYEDYLAAEREAKRSSEERWRERERDFLREQARQRHLKGDE